MGLGLGVEEYHYSELRNIAIGTYLGLQVTKA